MDAFQIIVTTTAVIIVLLLMVYFACQLGPRANAWLRSTREEKIGLSHKKLYNANGYLIRSGSEFLLSSTGSFKRFDSVDRDCKQQDARNSPAPSSSSAVSPLWTLSAANIPGQPLRPAPSPPPSASATTHKLQFFGTGHSLEQGPQQHHHHPIKQQSWAGRCASPSPTTIVSTSTAAIPRPTAKRQLSTPASICYSPIKLRSPKLSREANTNPFLAQHTEEDPEPQEAQKAKASDREKETITVVATETANPSRLPDLISDYPVLCRRLKSPSESATQPQHLPLCSVNPFCTDSLHQVLGNSSGEEHEQKGSVITNALHSDSAVLLAENPTAIVKPLTRERLIFNFDNAIVESGIYTSVESATGELFQVNGENMYLRGCGDLISLDMADDDEGRGVVNSSGGREVGSASDENVINALREAEGSIRKLELASTRHEVKEEEGEQDRNVDMIEKYSYSSDEPRLAAKHFLINSDHNTAPDGPYHGLDVDYNNRMSKYEDSLASDSHEELLLMSCQRRFRSHSETEATISIFDRLLSQQRRMMLSSNNPNNNFTNIARNSNNPFFSPDLLQSHDNHLMRSSQKGYSNNCNSGGGGGGGGGVSNFSPARTPLIRSNGMMIKQNLQQQEQQHQTQRRGSRGSANISTTGSNASINPFKPILSKTVSETYLGQFMATSALPRSSSILQLLEQHQQPPPSPTLPSSSWAFGDSSGRCAVGGGNKERSNSCMKSSWSKHESGDGIPKVSAFANSCTSAGGNFKRTLSSESFSSQSSVLIADLEPVRHNRLSATPPVTGYLCVGLQYDKNNTNEEGAELIVTVLEAKELLGPIDISSSSSSNTPDAMDTFVRIYLVPDEERAMQTKLFKNSTCPSYNETFSFWVSRKHHRHSLWFHLYHSGFNQHTLIGEGELQIGDAKRPLTTWLALSDSRHSNSSAANFGELMFSLSYLPTAERLTVVVVKGRNLQFEEADGEGEEDQKQLVSKRDKRNSISTPSTQTINAKQQDLTDELSSASSSSLCDIADQLARKRNSCTAADAVANVIVKVYLLKDGKKVSKKKTTIKRMEGSPIYNESMIFSVPPYMLGSIQIRLTVAQIVVAAEHRRMQFMPIGHVIVGNEATGKGLKHWNQMMTSLRKPVAMWHPLRRCPKESCSGTSGTSVEAECENKK